MAESFDRDLHKQELPKDDGSNGINRREALGALMGAGVLAVSGGVSGAAEARSHSTEKRGASENLESSENTADVTAYVDALSRAVSSTNIETLMGEDEQAAEKAWEPIEAETNKFLRAYLEARHFARPVGSVQLVAMHHAVVDALRRHPDNDLLIFVLEFTYRNIASEWEEVERGGRSSGIPPVRGKRESDS